MYSDASMYSQNHSMQERDTNQLLSDFCPRMSWKSKVEVVMDVGCGPGDTTRNLLLPALPQVGRIHAVDVLPKMIDYAKSHNEHEIIEYNLANIEIRSTLEPWQGKITKLFSIYCFNWVINQKKAFKNIHALLTEGGEALILFVINTRFWDCYPEIIDNPKWNKYLKDVPTHIPESHPKGYGSEYYKKMLEDIGFTVLSCEAEKRTFSYKNDTEGRAASSSRCAFTEHVPEHLREDFKDDLFRKLLKHNGRNLQGQPTLQYTALTLHIKKI